MVWKLQDIINIQTKKIFFYHLEGKWYWSQVIKTSTNSAQWKGLGEGIKIWRRETTWCVLGMMNKSDWLHHLTYIEKQCEKRLEYIAHGEIQIIISSFKTLLAIIGSCHEFQGKKSWRKVRWFRIITWTTIDRMTWRTHLLEVIIRVKQRAMRQTC